MQIGTLPSTNEFEAGALNSDGKRGNTEPCVTGQHLRPCNRTTVAI